MKKSIGLLKAIGLVFIGLSQIWATDKTAKPLSFEVTLGSIPNTSFDTTFVLTAHDPVSDTLDQDYDAIVIDHYIGDTDKLRHNSFQIVVDSQGHRILLIHAALKTTEDIPQWKNQLNLTPQGVEQIISLISTLRQNLFDESKLTFTDPHQKEAWLKLKEKPMILSGGSFGGKTTALIATDPHHHGAFDGYISASAWLDPLGEMLAITDNPNVTYQASSWASSTGKTSQQIITDKKGIPQKHNWAIFNLNNLSKPLFLLHGLKDVRVTPGSSQAVLENVPHGKRHFVYNALIPEDSHALETILSPQIQEQILHFIQQAVIAEKQGTRTRSPSVQAPLDQWRLKKSQMEMDQRVQSGQRPLWDIAINQVMKDILDVRTGLPEIQKAREALAQRDLLLSHLDTEGIQKTLDKLVDVGNIVNLLEKIT
jgi:hypothetical protein